METPGGGGWPIALMVLTLSASASAQVYKYQNQEGTVVFTDKLSDLPPERRAYYNRARVKAEKRLEQERARMSARERRAAELEEQRAQLIAEEMDAAARRQRLAELDAAIKEYRQRKKRETQRKAYWQEKQAAAQNTLAEALAAYRRARTEWEGLATNVGYTLFPGQQQRLIALQEELPKLEAEVDAANLYLTETLPEEARKAGVPPGWLRE